MTFTLSDLPYSRTALEPHVSRDTLDLHHGKHHRGYVEKLNKAIAGTRYEGMGIEDIITKARDESDTAIYNNAAQSWNHAFLWHSMSPDGGGEPGSELQQAIVGSFNDMDQFRSRFKSAALSQFGSGWAWLVRDGDELRVITTSNADTPIIDGMRPLLTLDVWEHAYYLDYQNERDRYIDTFLRELVNWEFAAMNFEVAKKAA